MSVASFTSSYTAGGTSMRSKMMNKSVQMGDEQYIQSVEYTTVVHGSNQLIVYNPNIIQSLPINQKEIRINNIIFNSESLLSTLPDSTLRSIHIKLTASHFQNQFDQSGNQSTTIGYLNFNTSKRTFIGSTIQFDQDAKKPVNIMLNIETSPGSGIWNPVNMLPTDSVYYEYLVCYEYNI